MICFLLVFTTSASLLGMFVRQSAKASHIDAPLLGCLAQPPNLSHGNLVQRVVQVRSLRLGASELHCREREREREREGEALFSCRLLAPLSLSLFQSHGKSFFSVRPSVRSFSVPHSLSIMRSAQIPNHTKRSLLDPDMMLLVWFV